MRKILGALVAAAALAFTLTPAAPAAAASCSTAWTQPNSADAKACRMLGWTITHQLVVTPQGVALHSSLPQCDTAPRWLRPCGSNLNGHRDATRPSYWIDSDRAVHYVWTHQPAGGWHWPTSAEQRRFDLASTPKAQVRTSPDGEHKLVRLPSGHLYVMICHADECARLQVR